jgi:hypothetical protein
MNRVGPSRASSRAPTASATAHGARPAEHEPGTCRDEERGHRLLPRVPRDIVPHLLMPPSPYSLIVSRAC